MPGGDLIPSLTSRSGSRPADDPVQRGAFLFAFFPVGISAGMILGWRWEGLGHLVTILSLLAFYGVHGLGGGELPAQWAFVVLAAPGVLFVASRWASAHARKRVV